MKIPKVSVYWLSLHRLKYLKESVLSFIENTCYQNLEFIIVDCSINDNETRNWISECNFFTKILFRDDYFCAWNNANLAFENCTGDYIIHFENDIILKKHIKKTWLNDIIKLLKNNSNIAYSLAVNGKDVEPHALGFIAHKNLRQKWHPWKSYPSDFMTITEAMNIGDRARKSKFYELGFKANGQHIINHSMSAPSMNLAKLHRLKGMDYELLDKRMREGIRVTRYKDIEYLDVETYHKIGSWKACDWTLTNEEGKELDSNILYNQNIDEKQ